MRLAYALAGAAVAGGLAGVFILGAIDLLDLWRQLPTGYSTPVLLLSPPVAVTLVAGWLSRQRGSRIASVAAASAVWLAPPLIAFDPSATIPPAFAFLALTAALTLWTFLLVAALQGMKARPTRREREAVLVGALGFFPPLAFPLAVSLPKPAPGSPLLLMVAVGLDLSVLIAWLVRVYISGSAVSQDIRR